METTRTKETEKQNACEEKKKKTRPRYIDRESKTKTQPKRLASRQTRLTDRQNP